MENSTHPEIQALSDNELIQKFANNFVVMGQNSRALLPLVRGNQQAFILINDTAKHYAENAHLLEELIKRLGMQPKVTIVE